MLISFLTKPTQAAIDYHWLKNPGGGLAMAQLPSLPQTGKRYWHMHDAELKSSVPGCSLASVFFVCWFFPKLLLKTMYKCFQR